jgi:hypothetical protein
MPRAEVWTAEAPMTNSDDVVKLWGGDYQVPCMFWYGAAAKEGDGRSRWERNKAERRLMRSEAKKRKA